MQTMPRFSPVVKPDTDFTADWPSWVDDDLWVPSDPGPDATDLEWAAREFNDDGQAVDELAAAESAYLDAHELGLLSPGLAESLARTSLVGLGDEMTAAYADVVEEVSGSRPSPDRAAREVSLAWFRLANGL